MRSDPDAQLTQILSFVGVYDADGSLRGELAYWFGARLGRRHCALCDITHGIVREREDWRQERDALGVPFATVHRDEASPDVLAVVVDDLPAVVAVTAAGVTALLGPSELSGCAGSPLAMVEALRGAVDLAGLTAASEMPDTP